MTVDKLELNGEIVEIGDLVIGEGNVHGTGLLVGKVKELTDISHEDVGINYTVPEDEYPYFMWLLGRYTLRLDKLNELIRIKHDAINELEAAIREAVNEKREINEKLEDLKGALK